jgi:SNF2 family DNA or RNA helicase
MKIFITGEDVNIMTQGVEFLKIKAELSKFIGNVLYSSKTELKFPLACLDIVLKNIPMVAEHLPKERTFFDLHALARQKAISSLEEKATSNILPEWENILDIPQQYAVEAMVTKNLLGICLFDEQGSGKTVMAISSFDILKSRDEIDAMIVICPKSMISGWESDIKKFLGNKYTISIADGNSMKKRQSALSDFCILISNYESLDIIITSLIAVSSKKHFLLVVDESFFTKNETAKRSVSVMNLRNVCTRCFVLCGTPAPNSPYDLINQFNIADKGYTFSTFTPSKDVENDKLLIAELIESRGTFIRRLKTEILSSVSDKHFHIISIPLIGYQKEIYEKARNNLELELRSYDNKTFKRNLMTYFQKRAALLQICAIPSNIDPTFLGVPVKYTKLDEVLDELFAQKRKVIIWTSYKASIKEIAARYKNKQPLIIDGNTSTVERKNAVYQFQNNPDFLLLIANPSAAGAGITLHASFDAIYISYTNQAAHYLQSLDRIHRRGQKSEEVNYYLFICENTIEETEVIRLRNRELQQHELLGDSCIWPTSLDDALSELVRG